MSYFLDTEFNGMGGDLISLALVRDDGLEFYLATRLMSKPVPWVSDNVIPIVKCLGARPVMCSAEAFGTAIMSFLFNDRDPVIIADWPDDIAYFCKALIVGPGKMVNITSLRFELIRVDAYPTTLAGAVQHNALWDARVLRHKLIGVA